MVMRTSLLRDAHECQQQLLCEPRRLRGLPAWQVASDPATGHAQAAVAAILHAYSGDSYVADASHTSYTSNIVDSAVCTARNASACCLEWPCMLARL